MRPVHRLATLSAALVLAACSGGGASPTSAPTGGNPVVTAAATVATAPCADSTDPTIVEASVSDNTWSQPVEAAVGDVITWKNEDGVPHRVALDDGSCSMAANISGGGSKSLAFSVAGTYPFHCSVHASMTGVITIK